jgi:hypothetical protein
MSSLEGQHIKATFDLNSALDEVSRLRILLERAQGLLTKVNEGRYVEDSER